MRRVRQGNVVTSVRRVAVGRTATRVLIAWRTLVADWKRARQLDRYEQGVGDLVEIPHDTLEQP